MGNIVKGTTRKWNVVDHDPTTWSLDHVEALRRRHRAGAHGFGLSKEELKDVVRAVLPDARRDIVEDALWPRFAEYDSGGEVNVLEVLGGCCVVSRAPLDDKVRFCLTLFDFNDVGSLSYDEAVGAGGANRSGNLWHALRRRRTVASTPRGGRVDAAGAVASTRGGRVDAAGTVASTRRGRVGAVASTPPVFAV